MTITFNNTYGSGITSQSAAFQTTFTNLVTGVEAFFSQQFSDTVTLNVTFDWQPLNPGYVSGGFTLGSNNFSLHTASYADIRNALIGHVSTNDSNPGDDAATIAALPATDPAPTTGSNTARYLVTNGQEKLLGLNGVGANDNLGADATITLASDLPNSTFFDFDRSDGIGAKGFDAFGVLAHEISEGLFGRIMSGGGVPKNGTTNDYNIMDLFHYTAAGARAMLETGGNNLLSFSGTTGDPNMNRVLDNSGDIADPSSGADPRSSFADGNTGVIQEITQTGLRTLDALGWTRANGLDDHNQSNTAATTVLNAGAANGIDGSLELQGDHDWFKVTLDGSKNYAIVTEGSATGGGRTLADPFVALYGGVNPSRDTTLPVQTANDGGVGANSLLLTSFGASGDYFADVGSIAGNVQDINKGTYRVSLIEDDFRQDTNTTGTVAAGSSTTGNIQFAKDHDWLKINLTTGENYAIIAKGNAGGLPDPQIQLMSPAGTSLATIHNNSTNNDADFGSGLTSNSRILWSRGIDDTLSAPLTDTYFLDVSSHIGNATGAYSVSVIKDDFRGDQFGNNGALTVGSLAGSAGKIEFQTDHDWFSAHLDAGTSYALRVRGADSNNGTLPNPDIDLKTAGGISVAGGTLLHDITATNHDARLLITPAATGDYFVDASSQIGADTGSYNAQALLASQLARPNDFNGDGTSDILWRAPAGSNLIWEIQNFAHTATDPLPQQAFNWKIAETGDFDGDLTTDILWSSGSGQLLEWHIVNGAISGAPIDLGFKSPALTVRGSGDFYKDGRSSILFRSSDGEVLTWETNPNGTFKTAMDSHGFVSRSDHIVSTGDFNGDGRAEILWRGNGGELLKSDATGSTLTLTSLGNLSSSWHVVGTGDFFGDGKQEAVISNAGQYKLADLNGGPLLGTTVTTQSTNWKLADIGDYNGDGKYDLLFNSTTGANKFVEANGAEHAIDLIGVNWVAQHHNYEFV
ncbi:MAG: VCBS repeat-containing protein [Betaproteobacteria bacterium]|nr:VCBS repeat-containing protein [Betaproteobacteria bacterium]